MYHRYTYAYIGPWWVGTWLDIFLSAKYTNKTIDNGFLAVCKWRRFITSKNKITVREKDPSVHYFIFLFLQPKSWGPVTSYPLPKQ